MAARATSSAGASGRAIAANESLWRWGVAVHLLYLGLAVLVDVLLYELLRPVQATLARLALVFALVALAVEAVSLLQLTVPLVLIEEGGAVAALGDGQREAVAYLADRLFSTGFGVSLTFFAGFCALTGVLLRRSRLVPGVIGAAMVVAGACYFANSLALLVSPALSELLVPWILLPCLAGELSLALWLALRGVRAAAVAAPAAG